jgi:peroxiredoxin
MGHVLVVAGVYNLVWGAVAILFPNAYFDLVGMPRPAPPGLWQCIGMIVGVYGIGYLIAAFAPARHWPIVLVGLLGKIFGPIGFLSGVLQGELPWSFGATIVTNDLIWWIPFTLILRHAYRGFLADGRETPELSAALAEACTSTGATLAELSRSQPRLVVFLRHFGCTFCREALDDLRRARARIEASGAGLVLVHLVEPERAAPYFRRADLADVPAISDPEARLYRAFGLARGRLGQLFGGPIWPRAFAAIFRGRHGLGPLAGDGFRMPGAFLVADGRIVQAFRHATAADRPDYVALAACPRPS